MEKRRNDPTTRVPTLLFAYSIRNTFQPSNDTPEGHLSGRLNSSGDLRPHAFRLGICGPTHMDNHPHPRVERAGEISDETN